MLCLIHVQIQNNSNFPKGNYVSFVLQNGQSDQASDSTRDDPQVSQS